MKTLYIYSPIPCGLTSMRDLEPRFWLSNTGVVVMLLPTLSSSPNEAGNTETTKLTFLSLIPYMSACSLTVQDQQFLQVALEDGFLIFIMPARNFLSATIDLSDDLVKRPFATKLPQ